MKLCNKFYLHEVYIYESHKNVSFHIEKKMLIQKMYVTFEGLKRLYKLDFENLCKNSYT